MVANNSSKNIIDGFTELFTLKDDKTTSGTTLDTFDQLELEVIQVLQHEMTI